MREQRVLRIGVTGHRAIDDEQAVAAVDAVLDRLQSTSDGARKLEVRSSLAEGADRLVASRVLDRPGAGLVAILPLDPDDYAGDFSGASSHESFRELLAAAERVEVTGPDQDGSRDSAYERAGIAVVDGSDVLVALWDGTEARGQGGTADIVAYARGRGVPVEVIPVERAAEPQ